MILQNLLEDKRYEWQKNAQQEIIDSLLCPVHRYKKHGHNADRLVMVFGKSHAGKTTFILTLMGVDESKLAELDDILRADIPKGESSTSTAIIYQKSDDDKFGYCERNYKNIIASEDSNLKKCDEEEFKQHLKYIRSNVEDGHYTNNRILYLYIPRSYFLVERSTKARISILDVPGFETTNEKEGYHTKALLSKYMLVSVLNIIVTPLNEHNDLRDFNAPNGDNATKLLSGKYIVVTTRSYSPGNISKYFKKDREIREKTFEDMMEQECSEEFKRAFKDISMDSGRYPRVFPVDLGDSFKQLINKKITNIDDRKEIKDYRNKVFNKIYEEINCKQSNSLDSWVKEVTDDEKFYSGTEIQRVDSLISQIGENRKRKNELLRKIKERIEKIIYIGKQLEGKKKELVKEKEQIPSPNYDDIIYKEIERYKQEFFSDKYEWKDEISKKNRNVASHLAERFSSICRNIIDENFDEKLTQDQRKDLLKKVDEKEIEIQKKLDEELNPHRVFKFLNKKISEEKVNIGVDELKNSVPKIGEEMMKLARNYYKVRIKEYDNKRVIISCLLEIWKADKKAVNETLKAIDEKIKELENEKEQIRKQVETDEKILKEYRRIVRKCFYNQYSEIVKKINSPINGEDKACYVILLGLMNKDYEGVINYGRDRE